MDIDTEARYLAEINALIAEHRAPGRPERVKARQAAIRQAWRTGRGPQLSLMERLAVLDRIEETTK
jgi:hypothetical protein